MKIEPQIKGAFFGRRRGNEVVRLLNALSNMRVEFTSENSTPEVLISDVNTVIKIPFGGGSGGGLPPGSIEKVFDAVDADTNQPITFIFYGREP